MSDVPTSTSTNEATPAATPIWSGDGGASDLGGRTLRMVVLLVAVCVVFVGALSASAVLLTSKAVGGASSAAAHEPSASVAKKPLSI